MTTPVISEEELDKEWVDLILYALGIGISKDEIQVFLNNSRPS